MRVFAYYTAILGVIYNMQRTKKAKGQIVRRRGGTDGETRRERERVRRGEEGEREGGGRGGSHEAASIQKHRV